VFDLVIVLPTPQPQSAVEFKNKGNELFREEKFEEALEMYNKAVESDPTDAVFYSNRSACLISLQKYKEALADSKQCIRLRPDWAKGYFRRATALHKLFYMVECKSCCKKGLELEATAELKELKDAAHNKVAYLFSNACDIDFKMDKAPFPSFRSVYKNKLPDKDVPVDATFPMSKRTLLHVATLSSHAKPAAELKKRGARVDLEDVFGLTPLHYAALIDHDGFSQALPWNADVQPISSSHHATPAALHRLLQFYDCPAPVPVRFWDAESGKIESLDRQALLVKDNVFLTQHPQVAECYLNLMLSAITDDSKLDMSERGMRIMKAAHDSDGTENIVLAKISDKVGLGVFAGRAFKDGDYICSVIGVCRGMDRVDDVHINPHAWKILPDFDYRIDCSEFRSAGAYVNHSAAPNADTTHTLCRGVPTIVVLANRDIAAGEQVCIDYKGRISASTPLLAKPEENMEDMYAAAPNFPAALPSAAVAAL